MVVQVVQDYGLVLVSSIKTGTVQASSGFVPSNVKNSVNDLLKALSYQFVVLMDALSQQKDHCVVTTLAQTSSFNAYQNRKEVKYMYDRAKDDGGCDGR